MPASLQLIADLAQLCPHPFRDRDALEPEPARPGLRADVREPQEVERLRLTRTARLPSPGGVPPELDQPRLVRVQLQSELRQPLAKLGQEPPRILLIFEPDDEVVRKPHRNDLPVRVLTPPPVDPQVVDIVQVNVRQERGHRCPLWRTFLTRCPLPVLDDPRSQPLPDQPQDPLVRDPVLQEPSQPNMIKLAEKVADIRVEHPSSPSSAQSRPRARPTHDPGRVP